MAVSKDIVQKYIDSALKSEVLEDSFMSFASPYDEEFKSNGHSCPILLTISQNSEPEKIIKHYVNLMSQVKSPAKFDVLFDTLRVLVREHPNLGKPICEALLSCDKLDYYNRNSWMRSFDLISQILPNVDYKGVRDILKHVLEIIYSLPDRFDIELIPQMDTLYSTFSMILDRESCLLPAYLSLDELQKKIAQSNAPVWKFSELFYHFIESFRPTAQIFSIVNRSDLMPVVGCSTYQSNSTWRLDHATAKFKLNGLLPYKDKLKRPQIGQVRYLLEQPYSREMLCSTLSISTKPVANARCAELIEQIALTIVHTMEKSEVDIESHRNQNVGTSEHLFQWQHLANNILLYIVFNQQTISFNQLIESLCDKLRAKNLRRGREHLMWALLQYITGSSKSSLSEVVAVIKLIEILYPCRRPLPLPDKDFHLSTHVFAAASIWFHLVKRAEIDQVKFPTPLPSALQIHYEYITKTAFNNESICRVSHSDAVLLNAHGAGKNGYPISNFVDCLCKIDPANSPNPMLVKPLPVGLLDSLNTPSKLALLHAIAQVIISLAQNKGNNQSNCVLTPALIETYGRLLVYPDSESYGLKSSFFNSLMGGPTSVCRSQAWHIYHVLLEMYSYRIHHLPIQYKFQMLIHLHNLSPMVYTANQTQLSMTMESTELKLLLGLSNYEPFNMSIAGSRQSSDAKTAKHMIHGDSEELNKVLVLVLARSTHVTVSEQVMANFLEEILTDINRITPLSWSVFTLHFFPKIMSDFYSNLPSTENSRPQLRPAVDEEYRKWRAMPDDAALLTHFSQPNAPPLFICIIWKMLVENDPLNPIVYRILDNIRIRTLSAHIRTFVDYLVFEFSNSVAGQHINKYAEALNDLIWKYHVITLDRLLLSMCLRSFESNEAQVCFFIIQYLLIKFSDFKNTVQQLCRTQSPEHWQATANSFALNLEFRRKHPEKFYHDYLTENNIQTSVETLPSFFSNVCLRFIPVFDILIHRALEIRILSPNAALKLDVLLDEFGCIYRFHDKPITYLYNTLHYYNTKLPPSLKRKLVQTIVRNFDDLRPANWCLSEPFVEYMNKCDDSSNQPSAAEDWIPGTEYYRGLIGRLVETLHKRNTFYHTDWRFNEFLNVKSHAVYSTAIELMALPQPPQVVGNAILDLVLNLHVNQERSSVPQWMNAIGLVMTSLPPAYYNVLNAKILEYMKSPLLVNPTYTKDILHLMNFCDSHEWMYESQISYLAALIHAIWHHSSTGQIFTLPQFWRTEVRQAVETESQFLFICCLIGPFLPRLERSRVMMDVVVELYEILGKVDASTEIYHLNTICDFFYHIKYQFTGDAVKNEIERCIRNFKPKLQYCLRFITHLNVSIDHQLQQQQHLQQHHNHQSQQQQQQQHKTIQPQQHQPQQS